MKLRVVPSRTARARSAGWRTAFCLLPVVAVSAASTFAPGPHPAGVSRAYLPIYGPPPLRFAEATPPPDLSARPAIGAPPQAGGEGSPPTTNTLPVATETPGETRPDVIPAPHLATSLAPSPAAAPGNDPASTAPPPGRTVAPVLADDTRPRVKPEDFLPFFVFPNESSAPQVVVPAGVTPAAAPAAQPASSATYRQQ